MCFLHYGCAETELLLSEHIAYPDRRSSIAVVGRYAHIAFFASSYASTPLCWKRVVPHRHWPVGLNFPLRIPILFPLPLWWSCVEAIAVRYMYNSILMLLPTPLLVRPSLKCRISVGAGFRERLFFYFFLPWPVSDLLTIGSQPPFLASRKNVASLTRLTH